MSTLAVKIDPLATAVTFTPDSLRLTLADGREVAAPLAWFPRLLAATPAQLFRAHTEAGIFSQWVGPKDVGAVATGWVSDRWFPERRALPMGFVVVRMGAGRAWEFG